MSNSSTERKEQVKEGLFKYDIQGSDLNDVGIRLSLEESNGNVDDAVEYYFDQHFKANRDFCAVDDDDGDDSSDEDFGRVQRAGAKSSSSARRRQNKNKPTSQNNSTTRRSTTRRSTTREKNANRKSTATGNTSSAKRDEIGVENKVDSRGKKRSNDGLNDGE